MQNFQTMDRIEKPKDSLLLSILSSKPPDSCDTDEKFVKRYCRQRECLPCKNKVPFTECQSPCNALPMVAQVGQRPNMDEVVISLLRKMISRSDGNGRTSLHYAVARCSTVVLSLLISLGADVRIRTIEGHSLLWFAVQTDCVHTTQLLLQSGCDSEEHRLRHALFAIERNKPHMVQILVHNGLNVNLRFGRFNRSLLHRASERGLRSIVTTLIAHGAHINASDSNHETPLFYAIRNLSSHVPPVLLQSGANVNHRNKSSQSVLHFVVEKYDRPNMLNLLVRYGADVNALADSGETPLFYNLRKGCYGSCDNDPLVLTRHWQFKYFERRTHIDYGTKELLSSGAKIGLKNRWKCTALHVAARYGCPYKVQQLLDSGAYVNEVDSSGASPLQIAVAEKHLYVVQQLLYAGANPEAFLTGEESWLANDMKRVFAKFVIAKRVARLGSRKYELPMEMDFDLEDFEESCVREVEYMRTAETAKRGLTLLTFLRANRRRLANLFSRNRKNFLNFIDKRHYTVLPIYREVLEKNFVIMTTYGPLLGNATELLLDLTGNRLLNDIAVTIIDKLNLEDLRNFVNARKDVDN